MESDVLMWSDWIFFHLRGVFSIMRGSAVCKFSKICVEVCAVVPILMALHVASKDGDEIEQKAILPLVTLLSVTQ